MSAATVGPFGEPATRDRYTVRQLTETGETAALNSYPDIETAPAAARRARGLDVGDDIPQVGYEALVADPANPARIVTAAAVPRDPFVPTIVDGDAHPTAREAATFLERRQQQSPHIPWPDDLLHIWLPTDALTMVCDSIANPDGIWFDRDLLPSRNGIIMFASRISLVGAFAPEDLESKIFGISPINTISWTYDDEGSLYLTSTGAGASAEERWNWPAGHVEAQFVHSYGAGRLVAALFNLMAQKGVLEAYDDRFTASRTVRVGKKQTKRRVTTTQTIRVVHLRPGTPYSDAYTRQADGTRIFQHRWVVRGHWRLQPYRSTLDEAGEPVRRRIWIAPYLKGPDGAPLLTGPKVVVVHPPKDPA